MSELRKHFEDSDDLCRYIRSISGPQVLLSFSRGKDAIACWLQLRDHFEEVVPYYLYSVPGMRFVEESLSYYEDFFKTKILRLPHPSFYGMLNDHIAVSPERIGLAKAVRLRDDRVYDYAAAERAVRAWRGLDTAWAAVGVREVDSISRRLSIATHGPLEHKRRSFYPVYDWSAAKLRERMARSGVKLPVDYRLFGRSWDGLQWDFLEPIRREFPEDYQRILDWFPMADAVLWQDKFYQPDEGKTEESGG